MSRATRVQFRADIAGDFEGDVTAVFPDLSEGRGEVTCYAHIGQHSTCSRAWIASTRPATPEEYADLKLELEGLGYVLKVV